MQFSASAIVADEKLSDSTKERLLSENLRVLRMQRDMLRGRIEVTLHELESIHRNDELLTEPA